MKSENVTDYEMNNQSTDESVQPVSTVQEVGLSPGSGLNEKAGR